MKQAGLLVNIENKECFDRLCIIIQELTSNGFEIDIYGHLNPEYKIEQKNIFTHEIAFSQLEEEIFIFPKFDIVIVQKGFRYLAKLLTKNKKQIFIFENFSLNQLENLLKKQKKETLYIVLPHRIGDSILTIPALKVFKNLFNDKYNVKLITNNFMFPLFKDLNLFPVEIFSWWSKIKTWIKTPDKIFYFLCSSKTLGYRGKYTYGQSSYKRYLKYSYDIPYLCEIVCDNFAKPNLYKKLKESFGFSNVIINNFALPIAFGADEKSIYDSLKENFTKTKIDSKGEYIVCCMEAGYKSKHSSNRRWKIDFFLEIAEFIYKKFQIKTVFIGMNLNTDIPQNEYMIDKRGTISIQKMQDIIKHSIMYFGNDTGPLHLANYCLKQTVGIYLDAKPEEYGPINAHNNIAFYKPNNINDVKQAMQKKLCESKEY